MLRSHLLAIGPIFNVRRYWFSWENGGRNTNTPASSKQALPSLFSAFALFSFSPSPFSVCHAGYNGLERHGTNSWGAGTAVACENIRFSSLFAAGDVSRETSPATNSEEKRMFLQASTAGNSWWACAAQFSKSWPYFRPKNVICHTRFQTRLLKSIPVFRPGL